MIQAGHGSGRVLVEQMRQRELVFELRHARIERAHSLEFRDRPGRLAFGQPDTAAQQEGLVIDGLPGENALNQFVTVVVLPLLECNFGQPIPCRNVIWRFLRDSVEDLLSGLQIAGLDFKVGVSEPPE